jgi:hypothetical protein
MVPEQKRTGPVVVGLVVVVAVEAESRSQSKKELAVWCQAQFGADGLVVVDTTGTGLGKQQL